MGESESEAMEESVGRELEQLLQDSWNRPEQVWKGHLKFIASSVYKLTTLLKVDIQPEKALPTHTGNGTSVTSVPPDLQKKQPKSKRQQKSNEIAVKLQLPGSHNEIANGLQSFVTQEMGRSIQEVCSFLVFFRYFWGLWKYLLLLTIFTLSMHVGSKF
jgi:hypothetical protein